MLGGGVFVPGRSSTGQSSIHHCACQWLPQWHWVCFGRPASSAIDWLPESKDKRPGCLPTPKTCSLLSVSKQHCVYVTILQTILKHTRHYLPFSTTYQKTTAWDYCIHAHQLVVGSCHVGPSILEYTASKRNQKSSKWAPIRKRTTWSLTQYAV